MWPKKNMPKNRSKKTEVLEVREEALTETQEDRGEVLRNTIPLVPQLAIALGVLVLLFGISYLPTFSERKATQEPTSVEARVIEASGPETTEDLFEDVSVTAASAYVWDVRNQRALFNKNASAQLPLASLTKLMTALVAAEHLAGDDVITITDAAIRQDGNSGFDAGERFAFLNLIDLTLITSSNDGAYALAAAAGDALNTDAEKDGHTAFLDAMNKKALELGLSQTYYRNATGLDTNAFESGSYGSARDMSFLMEYIITKHPDIFERTTEGARTITDLSGNTFIAENTSPITREIPGLIASKTGYTDLAGGNLVVAFDAGFNRPIIVTVLGSTYHGRFDDVLELANKARAMIAAE